MKNNVETLIQSFSLMRRVYANELHKRFKEDKFTPNEINILILLSNNNTIDTSSQITMMLNVSKGLVSRSIDSLIHKELIVCVTDEKDKRIQRIKLSDGATPVIKRIHKEMKEINEELLVSVSEKEIIQMKETMNKIVTYFKNKEEY